MQTELKSHKLSPYKIGVRLSLVLGVHTVTGSLEALSSASKTPSSLMDNTDFSRSLESTVHIVSC